MKDLEKDKGFCEEIARRIEGPLAAIDSVLEELRSTAVQSGSRQMYVETALERVHELINGCVRRLK